VIRQISKFSIFGLCKTLKKKAARNSKMWTAIYQSTGCNIPDDLDLHLHHCGNLKPRWLCNWKFWKIFLSVLPCTVRLFVNRRSYNALTLTQNRGGTINTYGINFENCLEKCCLEDKDRWIRHTELSQAFASACYCMLLALLTFPLLQPMFVKSYTNN